MNKTLKKTLSIVLSILMIVTSVPVSLAAGDVNYIECSWDGTNNTVVSETKSVIEYTKITSDLTAWSTGWYVATGEVTIPSRVAVSGDVHLILCDYAVLTVNGGVRVEGKNSLTIYGQSDGTGKLIATATTDYYAGIGSNRNGGSEPSPYGTIVIHGGTVEATGAWGGAAGIGGGTRSGNGTILIYGGNITGTGTSNGAGIGSGGTSSQMTQNMGDITILGGIVTGRTLWGAGIGSGRGNKSGGSLTVLGDNVQGYSDGGRGEGIGRGQNAADIGKMVLSDGTPIISGAYTLPVSYTVDESNTLNVPAGTTLTIPAGVTLTNSGTITVQEGGTLINNGVIVQNGNFTNNGTFTCTHSVIADKWTTIEGMHYRECLSGCGGKLFEGACFGGEGTCLEDGICADCGAVYLPKNPNNHVSEETYIEYIDDSNHGLYHSCCKALIQEIPHTPAEGQEATCVGVAVCEDCGFAFGGNDSTNHISDDLEYVSAGKGAHILTHVCCGNPAAAAEGHNMSYTVNGELTIDGVCTDCGATGSVTLNPTEGGIYNGYEFVSDYSGTGILSGFDAFEKPVISGCCEDGCSDVGEHTVTMTMGGLSVSDTFTIAPKELTLTGVAAQYKEFDGTAELDVYGIDMEGIVVYKEGDYPYAMWDDIHDDVSLNYGDIVCTVDDVVPGTYETANVTGVTLTGNDAHNYVIAETYDDVPLRDSIGYAFEIEKVMLHIEALDQVLTGDAPLDQNAYSVDGLDEKFTIEGVLLYESSAFIDVDTENVVIRLNDEDVTEYFEISTYYANLSRVCEGHEFDENGFCSTGQCDSYEPAERTVGTDEWGMEVEYYDIYNAGQLYWFAEQVNVYGNNGINGRLMDNITVNEDITAENLRQWTPIGGGYTAYVGNFDGQGYTVSGLYFNEPEATMVGLFGYTDYAYVIENVNVSNSYFKADSYVGALIGSAGSAVSGCTVDGTVTVEGEVYTGGLIGYTSGGELTNSWSAAAVSENGSGLVGLNSATVTNCYTTASLLVGNNYYGGTTTNCYNLSETETEDGGKTEAQFASGEVAYLLQSGVLEEEIDGETVTPHIWGQKIGTDSYPVLGGETVYYNESNGYYNILHDCDFSGEWKYDADKHWKECTCGETGEEAEHTYTDGKCECGYECAHEWGEGVLTRPIKITTTDWDDGYYTYTCSACGHYYHEAVKRADYTALDAVLEDFIDAMYDTTLLDSIRNELQVIYFDNIKVLYGDYIESEQAEVDALVETMTQKLAEVEAGVADGSALKPNYTEGDALINGIIEQFYDKGITYVDEIIAEFDTLYNEYLAIWHKPETTKPQVDEIVGELKALKEKIDKGTEDGTLVKIDGMKEYNKIADALDAELMENYSQEEIAALAEKAGDEINARFGEIIEKAEALTGTVAENKDALAEIESEMRALYGEIKNCLDGVHNGLVYEVTEEAKCEVNAIESATCTLCGETDEREVEGSALTHSFTKYEETEAPKCGVAGKEAAICDNGCGATDEKEIPALTHKDADGDYKCDYGCGHEFEKPAEPEDPSANCDHLCHSNNWFVKNIIWKIVQFFWKLFKMNPVCECGAAHY